MVTLNLLCYILSMIEQINGRKRIEGSSGVLTNVGQDGGDSV